MKVTNIVSGRQIELHRAYKNAQFDFYFGVNNDYFVYQYYDEESRRVTQTRFPSGIDCTAYGIDRDLQAHTSVLINVDGENYRRGHFFRLPNLGRQNDVSISGISQVHLADELLQKFDGLYAEQNQSVFAEQNQHVFITRLIDGVLTLTDLVCRAYNTTGYRYVTESGVEHQIHLNDYERNNIIQMIQNRDTNQYVWGENAEGRNAIFENQTARELHGALPRLGGYHQTTRTNDIFSEESVNWFVGFEVEKEDLEARNRARRLDSNIGDGWVAESDSSLDGTTGVEFVSPVFDLFNTKNLFEQFDKFSWVMNAGYSRACGGHITISRRGMDADDLVDKLAPFAPLLFSLYEGRLATQWGGVQTKNEMKNGSRKAIHNCKRHYRSKNAVEIRIFSAVSTLESIKFRTKLVQWICAQIDKGELTTFTKVADAMFNDKKLNKLLRQQYSAEKLARKQALAYVFGGCLEGQSASDFLNSTDNYERTIERMKRAFNSVNIYVRREVESKFGSFVVNKAKGEL